LKLEAPGLSDETPPPDRAAEPGDPRFSGPSSPDTYSIHAPPTALESYRHCGSGGTTHLTCRAVSADLQPGDPEMLWVFYRKSIVGAAEKPQTKVGSFGLLELPAKAQQKLMHPGRFAWGVDVLACPRFFQGISGSQGRGSPGPPRLIRSTIHDYQRYFPRNTKCHHFSDVLFH